jgi:hypothetical protein
MPNRRAVEHEPVHINIVLAGVDLPGEIDGFRLTPRPGNVPGACRNHRPP